MSSDLSGPVKYVQTQCRKTLKRRLDVARNWRCTNAQVSHAGKRSALVRERPPVREAVCAPASVQRTGTIPNSFSRA
jgi:hypothetical protein